MGVGVLRVVPVAGPVVEVGVPPGVADMVKESLIEVARVAAVLVAVRGPSPAVLLGPDGVRGCPSRFGIMGGYGPGGCPVIGTNTQTLGPPIPLPLHPPQ